MQVQHLRFSVMYISDGPVWEIKPLKKYDVPEGGNLTIKAFAQANPGPVRYVLVSAGLTDFFAQCKDYSTNACTHMLICQMHTVSPKCIQTEGCGGCGKITMGTAFHIHTVQ